MKFSKVFSFLLCCSAALHINASHREASPAEGACWENLQRDLHTFVWGHEKSGSTWKRVSVLSGSSPLRVYLPHCFEQKIEIKSVVEPDFFFQEHDSIHKEEVRLHFDQVKKIVKSCAKDHLFSIAHNVVADNDWSSENLQGPATNTELQEKVRTFEQKGSFLDIGEPNYLTHVYAQVQNRLHKEKERHSFLDYGIVQARRTKRFFMKPFSFFWNVGMGLIKIEVPKMFEVHGLVTLGAGALLGYLGLQGMQKNTDWKALSVAGMSGFSLYRFYTRTEQQKEHEAKSKRVQSYQRFLNQQLERVNQNFSQYDLLELLREAAQKKEMQETRQAAKQAAESARHNTTLLGQVRGEQKEQTSKIDGLCSGQDHMQKDLLNLKSRLEILAHDLGVKFDAATEKMEKHVQSSADTIVSRVQESVQNIVNQELGKGFSQQKEELILIKNELLKQQGTMREQDRQWFGEKIQRLEQLVLEQSPGLPASDESDQEDDESGVSGNDIMSGYVAVPDQSLLVGDILAKKSFSNFSFIKDSIKKEAEAVRDFDFTQLAGAYLSVYISVFLAKKRYVQQIMDAGPCHIYKSFGLCNSEFGKLKRRPCVNEGLCFTLCQKNNDKL